MKVLITAGGTSEDIDSVRSITNYSTGRLGSIIADTFTQKNAAITYVCGDNALLPSAENIEIIRIKNTQELLEVTENLFNKTQFDCVIHSMAVSDFIPQAILTLDNIVENVLSEITKQTINNKALADVIRTAVLTSGKPLKESKINSENLDLMLLLKQTPKIIGWIKAKQPKTILVGFKLLSGVTEKELTQAGRELLMQNSCDFVLANNLQDIANDSHKAILLDKSGILQRVETKQEIAEVIYKTISERIKHDENNNTWRNG